MMNNIGFRPIILFLFGLVTGSFLNVCIYRLPRNCLSIISPGSHCPNCQKSIRWYDNIPVLSYLILQGQCRNCGTSISVQYPLVELLTGLIFFITYLTWHEQFQQVLPGILPGWTNAIPSYLPSLFSPSRVVFWSEVVIRVLFVSGLIIVSFVDYDFRIIPDELSLGGLVFALVLNIVLPYRLGIYSGLPEISPGRISSLEGAVGALVGMCIGGGIIYLLLVVGRVIFQKEAMGFGDVKFMATLGAFFGWISAPIILMLASFIGSIIGSGIYFIKNDRYLPFGPFLSMGAILFLWKGPWMINLLQEHFFGF